MRVVEIGGGLSGFQFVVASLGCDVLNVDPGMEAHGRGWPVDADAIDSVNRAFGTRVRLHPGVLSDAPIADGSCDVVYGISVVEHIPPGEIVGTLREAYRILRPGGHLVLTVDLFLNLRPFCSRTSNEFGTNVSVCELVESADFELVFGDRRELLGYPEFDPDRVLSILDELFVGVYPSLAQCLVLRRPGATSTP
jgi:SAM-dependent methyltransferase